MNDSKLTPPDWCKCKFTANELHGKSVQFRVCTQDGVETGKGTFVVEQGKNGYVRAAVKFLNENTILNLSTDKEAISSARIELIFLPQEVVNVITKNPPGSEDEFSIIADNK